MCIVRRVLTHAFHAFYSPSSLCSDLQILSMVDTRLNAQSLSPDNPRWRTLDFTLWPFWRHLSAWADTRMRRASTLSAAGRWLAAGADTPRSARRSRADAATGSAGDARGSAARATTDAPEEAPTAATRRRAGRKDRPPRTTLVGPRLAMYEYTHDQGGSGDHRGGSSGRGPSDAQVARFVGRVGRGVRHLSLASCTRTTDRTLISVAQHCPQLLTINIAGTTRVSARGVTAIATGCRGLTGVTFSERGNVESPSSAGRGRAPPPFVSDTSVAALVAHCPDLVTLRLARTNITHAALEAIAAFCGGRRRGCQ